MKEERPPYLPEDTFCMESRLGPTPNGGAYSTAIYRDVYGTPCAKDEADNIEIGEFTEAGERIGGVYGFVGDHSCDVPHPRCKWCENGDRAYRAYHDEEWGVPQHDDHMLFEMLILECFQAGLSWDCILKKRQLFRDAFDNFEVEKVANYTLEKKKWLLDYPWIVSNRLKIFAASTNAKAFIAIQQEFGSFDKYIWSWTNGKTIYESGLTTNAVAEEISKDLQKRGMKFVGPTIIYAYLQAIGIVNSHEPECFRYQKCEYSL